MGEAYNRMVEEQKYTPYWLDAPQQASSRASFFLPELLRTPAHDVMGMQVYHSIRTSSIVRPRRWAAHRTILFKRSRSRGEYYLESSCRPARMPQCLIRDLRRTRPMVSTECGSMARSLLTRTNLGNGKAGGETTKKVMDRVVRRSFKRIQDDADRTNICRRQAETQRRRTRRKKGRESRRTRTTRTRTTTGTTTLTVVRTMEGKVGMHWAEEETRVSPPCARLDST